MDCTVDHRARALRLALALAAGAAWLQGCEPPPEDDGGGETETIGQAAISASQSVLTQHNTPGRTGAYTSETVLTPGNVDSFHFGPIYRRKVTGNLTTQPLFVKGVTLSSGTTRDLVIVTTTSNWVYAFDANSSSARDDGGLVWKTNLGPTNRPFDRCREIQWSQGISSTPAIDATTNMLYVVARVVESGVVSHKLVRMDVRQLDDATRVTKSIKIAAAASGTAVPFAFSPAQQVNRAGLLLQGGNVYIGFATVQCDEPPYAGWVFSYRASDLAESTKKVFTTASSLNAGASAGDAFAGIWQSGSGLVGDGTSVYFATGNSRPIDGAGTGASKLSNSFLKLDGSTLALQSQLKDPADKILNLGDSDLAAGGPMLLPGGRIIGGGKQGVLHLADTSLAGSSRTSFQATWDSYRLKSTTNVCRCYLSAPPDPPECPKVDRPFFADQIYNRPCYHTKDDYPTSEHLGPNIHNSPAFFQSTGSTGFVYTFGEKDFLRAFQYDSSTRQIMCASGPMAGECNAQKVSSLRAADGMPGGFVSVSSNGTSNGIVWSLVETVDGQFIDKFGANNDFNGTNPALHQKVFSRLHASDALTLATLYTDRFDHPFVKFTPPTVAAGKVFRPTMSSVNTLDSPVSYLVVYGQLHSGKAWPKLTASLNSAILQ